jgi:hypothetical protein
MLRFIVLPFNVVVEVCFEVAVVGHIIHCERQPVRGSAFSE